MAFMANAPACPRPPLGAGPPPRGGVVTNSSPTPSKEPQEHYYIMTSRKRAAESSTAAHATAEENKRCRGAIDEMAEAAGRLDTGTEDYPQDFSHDGNPCWPRESRLVGLHSGPTSASPSVRTGQHLGRQTYVHDALVEHRWSFLAEDDDWLIGFHRYVEKELEKSKHWTCDEEEAAWIMTWVHRLIREPGFSRLRARADRHAERGPRFSILWCAPPSFRSRLPPSRF